MQSTIERLTELTVFPGVPCRAATYVRIDGVDAGAAVVTRIIQTAVPICNTSHASSKYN